MTWNTYTIQPGGLIQGWYEAPLPLDMDTGPYSLEFRLAEERGGSDWGGPVDQYYTSLLYGTDVSPECVAEIREWESYQNDEFVTPVGWVTDLLSGGVGGNCDFD